MDDVRVLLSAWVDAEQVRRDMCVEYFVSVLGTGGETDGSEQMLTAEALTRFTRIDQAVASARYAYFLALHGPKA
jgi:hypothetical protein